MVGATRAKIALLDGEGTESYTVPTHLLRPIPKKQDFLTVRMPTMGGQNNDEILVPGVVLVAMASPQGGQIRVRGFFRIWWACHHGRVPLGFDSGQVFRSDCKKQSTSSNSTMFLPIF